MMTENKRAQAVDGKSTKKRSKKAESEKREVQTATVSEPQEAIGNTKEPEPVTAKKISTKPGDEFTLQVYFDKGVQSFIGSVLEIPEIRASGTDKDAVVNELSKRLADYFDEMAANDQMPAEPIFNRRYPDFLEAKISQGLFRKLDWLSKQERVPLEQLVTELLSAGVERRMDVSRSQGHGASERRSQPHHQQPYSQHQNHHQPSRGQARPQQQQGQNFRRQGGGGQNRGRFQDPMQNGDNFLEYVRNLEKRGGGGWRKK